MILKQKGIDKLIAKQTKQLLKRDKHLNDIEVSCEKNKRGLHLIKLLARTQGKTLVISDEDYSLEKSVKRLFKSLKRMLDKRKFKKDRRVQFNLMEAHA